MSLAAATVPRPVRRLALRNHGGPRARTHDHERWKEVIEPEHPDGDASHDESRLLETRPTRTNGDRGGVPSIRRPGMNTLRATLTVVLATSVGTLWADDKPGAAPRDGA